MRQSSSASVYRAYDSELGELVALKRAADVQSSSRVVSEAKLLEGLQHPKLPIVIEHGVSELGLAYLVTRWIDGPTLAERLRVGPLPIDDAVPLAHELARVLGYLHDAGVVHRDVKPSNILLAGGATEDVRLVDFGIALSGGDQSETGFPLGTPGFMAPEQARGQAQIDARADVFGLGAVLFTSLTGRPPFVGDGVTGTLARLLFEATPSLKSALPSAPPWLEEVLHQLLAKSAGDCPSDGNAAARLLDPGSRDAAVVSLPGWALGDAEQRVVSVMCAAVSKEEPLDDITRSMVPSSRTGALGEDVMRAVRACKETGARVELIAGDVIVALIERGTGADERALGALACARCLEKELGRIPPSGGNRSNHDFRRDPHGRDDRSRAVLARGRPTHPSAEARPGSTCRRSHDGSPALDAISGRRARGQRPLVR